MKITPFLNKSLSYIRPKLTYWQLNPLEETGVSHPDAEPGVYPLNFAPRLKDGHFDRFDDQGLPLRPHRYDKKRTTHFYSTMCSYALAHWDHYRRTDNQESLSNFLNVADYLVDTADWKSADHAVLRGPGRDGGEHTGPACALNQGMAMSVLVRAWYCDEKEKYKNAALACLAPFFQPVEKDGVRGWFEEISAPWFEEHTDPPPRHILNGMGCALWGLYDLSRYLRDREAEELFNQGIKDVAKALPLFDTRNWSLYWYGENGFAHYIASMNYHNLHICQLLSLGYLAGNETLQIWSRRFADYARNPANRWRALVRIAREKRSHA